MILGHSKLEKNMNSVYEDMLDAYRPVHKVVSTRDLEHIDEEIFSCDVNS